MFLLISARRRAELAEHAAAKAERAVERAARKQERAEEKTRQATGAGTAEAEDGHSGSDSDSTVIV